MNVTNYDNYKWFRFTVFLNFGFFLFSFFFFSCSFFFLCTFFIFVFVFLSFKWKLSLYIYPRPNPLSIHLSACPHNALESNLKHSCLLKSLYIFLRLPSKESERISLDFEPISFKFGTICQHFPFWVWNYKLKTKGRHT